MPIVNEIEKSNLIYNFTFPFNHSDDKDHEYIGMTTITLKKVEFSQIQWRYKTTLARLP